ncbi:hypothetical protein D9611_009890 [Ephemerocybe angulata]|uniref:F-box domain-containing protein n=1 Tax=Ephemerocybe angulata TaxID=980116 RepID=A0A8H5FJQ8_9AGAR|nr:hypothetical protein D9611_009890 [Tulosesus angulatus]
MPSATFESQIELDREIARLEHDLVILKRRRNALSPVFRIPPELLSNIFFLALRFLEANGVTPQKLNPNVTKQAICAVSHQWRETAFAEPKLWMEIHVRDSTTTEYLDVVGKNLRENQEVHLEAHDIVKNYSALRHIFLHVLKVEKTRLKRVVISARHSYIVREILRESSLREDTVTLDLAFYHGSPVGGIDVTAQDIAAVFPHIRELRLVTLELPRAPDVLRLLNITDLSLIIYTADDIHQVFEILKSAERLVSFKLLVQHTENAIEGVLPSAEVELSRLKRFELDTSDTPLLLALLKPLRFRGKMGKVFITTRDTRRKELSHLLFPAIILAFPETSAPETAKVVRVKEINSREDQRSFFCYKAGWMDRQDQHLAVVLPVLQSDNSSSVLAPEIRPLSTLPFMDPDSWILNNAQDILVGIRPTLPFWECIARISTLRRLIIIAWDIDDCFLRILQGEVERPGNALDRALEVSTPFPALLNIKIDMSKLTTSGVHIDYARALAQALKARAAVAGRDEVPQISKLEFVSCTSPLDGETRDLLSSVALEVLWKMRK